MKNTHGVSWSHWSPGSHASEVSSVSSSLTTHHYPPPHMYTAMLAHGQMLLVGLFLICTTVLLTNAFALGLTQSQQKHQIMKQYLDRTKGPQCHDIRKWLNFSGLSSLIYKRKRLDFLNFPQLSSHWNSTVSLRRIKYILRSESKGEGGLAMCQGSYQVLRTHDDRRWFQYPSWYYFHVKGRETEAKSNYLSEVTQLKAAELK